MIGFKKTINGVTYDLHPYKEFRDEWDLVVDGKMVCDSKPYFVCLNKFLELIGDFN